jgi:hypothetical protein
MKSSINIMGSSKQSGKMYITQTLTGYRVVLCTADSDASSFSGVILYDNSTEFKQRIGHTSTIWASTMFTPFEGSVTIES